MLEIDAAVVTHVGKVRNHNEDSASLMRPSAPESLASHGVLALVADGMGGHNAGEHASRLASESMIRAYFDSKDEPREALVAAIHTANEAVFEAACCTPEWKGMGTTCVAVALCNDHAWWTWVGDSRLYLVRGGKTYRLTEDHTVVQDMVRRGWMTQQEARVHGDRNVLDRAIGTRRTVDAGACDAALPIKAGDRLLLCSDGLHDVVSDEEMGACIASRSAREAADRLLEMALERGGPDNVSILVLEARPEGSVRLPGKTKEHVLA